MSEPEALVFDPNTAPTLCAALLNECGWYLGVSDRWYQLGREAEKLQQWLEVQPDWDGYWGPLVRASLASGVRR